MLLDIIIALMPLMRLMSMSLVVAFPGLFPLHALLGRVLSDDAALLLGKVAVCPSLRTGDQLVAGTACVIYPRYRHGFRGDLWCQSMTISNNI